MWTDFLAVFRRATHGSRTLMFWKHYWILSPSWIKRGLLIGIWYSWCKDDLCIGILNFYFTALKLTVTPMEVLDKIFICLAYSPLDIFLLLTLFHGIQHLRCLSCSAFFITLSLSIILVWDHWIICHESTQDIFFLKFKKEYYAN